jgi:hypothetical protein
MGPLYLAVYSYRSFAPEITVQKANLKERVVILLNSPSVATVSRKLCQGFSQTLKWPMWTSPKYPTTDSPAAVNQIGATDTHSCCENSNTIWRSLQEMAEIKAVCF